VMLKAGDLGAGKYKMKITLNKPDGSEVPGQSLEVFFNGSDENGIAIISPMIIPNPDEGLHWFDVYFEDSRLTRIPMRVLYQQMQLMQLPRMG